jgi:hypothetical protein
VCESSDKACLGSGVRGDWSIRHAEGDYDGVYHRWPVMPGPDTYIHAAFPLSPKPPVPAPIYVIYTHTRLLFSFFKRTAQKKERQKRKYNTCFELSFTAYFGETD